jgi:ornithine carbamoyltransferase
VVILKGKDILSIMELNNKEINDIIEFALKLKKRTKPLLKNKVFAMIFQKPSTRTRVSFEVAMYELGGHAVNLAMNELQLSRGETIEDTARTLSAYTDAIGARVYDHTDVVKLAGAASVPVINMLSDLYHPCQVLGDLLTIHELKHSLKGLKLAWVGDGDNVCNSLIGGCAMMGMNISVACPAGYEPYPEAVDFAKREAARNRSIFEMVNDPRKVVKNADVVYTDSFVSMGKEAEKEQRLKVFLPHYQVNSELVKLAKRDAIFMHCLPAKRGQEVTDDVIDGKQSVVWQEAENRLHAQKALLCFLIRKNLKGL